MNLRTTFILSIILLPTLLMAHPASVFLPKISLAEKIDQHPNVVLARPTRLENPQYRVTVVLKTDGAVQRGDILTATISADPEAPGEIKNLMTSLLITRKNEKDGWVIQSPAGLHLTPFFRKVVKLPSNYADNEQVYHERLRYFLPLLAHPDTRIANSAVAAVGRSPFVVVRLLEEDLDRERVRNWIADPNQQGWRSLQFTLLGICGNDEDSAFVRERIDAMWAENDFFNLASVLVAYIELEGPAAADYILQAYFQDTDRTYAEIKEALVALAMQGDERTPLPREQAIAAFDWFLENRGPMAYLVVPHYTRWEHWEAMDRLAEMAITRGYQLPYIRKRVITYLEACPLPEAQQHLRTLARL